MTDESQSGAFAQCEEPPRRSTVVVAPVESRPVRHHTHEYHGLSRSRAYQSWKSMRGRCYLPSMPGYEIYGGRGISVCKRWNESFSNFLADMGPRPLGTSIDRIDPNGNYEPTNCRWATRSQQAQNMRTTTFVQFEGERMSLDAFAQRVGLNKRCVSGRLRHGWTPKEIASTPSRPGTRLKNVQAGLEKMIRSFRCETCDAPFQDQKSTRRFCSIACSGKAYWASQFGPRVDVCEAADVRLTPDVVFAALGSGWSTGRQLAASLGVPTKRVMTALSRMKARGMVEHAADRTWRAKKEAT